MVRVTKWEEFATLSKRMFLKSPAATRYTTTYLHKPHRQLVLKVTDNVTCLKFHTDQQDDMKLVERLNNMFIGLMALPAMDASSVAAMESEEKEREEKKVAAMSDGGGKKGGKKNKRN